VQARERWTAAGRPLVPSLLIGDVVTPILHVSQLSSLLGLDAPPQLEAPRLAWDAAGVLDAWHSLIRPIDFETLVAATPSRGRSLRNLTVNVFHPFELLPAAFDEGRFDWDPDLDGLREAGLQDAGAVVRYAADRSFLWQDWLREREADLVDGDRVVDSPRGRVAFASLLDAQRWHAAFHYRQVTAFLASRGHDLDGAFTLASLAGLELPPEIF
jgi:hypothetical protein